MTPAPIAVALDAPDLETAARWAGLVTPHVSTVKVGLELYLRYGPDVIASVRGASGGPAMIRAAVEAAPHTQIAAVTVLTSLAEEDLGRIGLTGPAGEAVRRLAAMSVEAGATALVCSPHEVSAVRAEVGGGITLITPGVRPTGADSQDQARVATPEQALADGADLLVIGRPITGSADPGATAAAIAASLRRTHSS